MSPSSHSPACLLLSFRRESRLTPSMPPLLVYLAALVPTVYGLSAVSYGGATVVAAAVILAATGNALRRLALILVYLLGLLWGQRAFTGGRNAYHRLIPRDHGRISALAFVTGNPVPPGERGTKHSFALRKIKVHGSWRDCTGSVLAHVGPETTLTHGQLYILRGFVRKTPSDGFGRHLLSQDIRHLLHVQHARLLRPPLGIHRLLADFYRFRNRLGQLLVSGMSPAAGDLYQSMLLGRRDLFPQETKMHFLRSATLHIFAISGLHVQMIFKTLLVAFQYVGLGKFSRLTISCLCSLTYVVLTGATPSSIRSGIMLMLFLIPLLLRRPNNSRHAICLAALLELAVAPLCLLHCGFLFSFIIVAALIYSAPLCDNLKALCFERWNWLPTCPQKHAAIKGPTKCWTALSALTVAWLVSLPIAMHLNGIISLGGIAIGIPAQLLALVLVGASIPKCILALTLPPLGDLLGLLMDVGMKLLVALAEWGGNQSFCLMRPHSSGSLAALFLIPFFILICHGWKCPASRCAACAILGAWLLTVILAPQHNTAILAIAQGTDGGPPALCLIPPQDRHITVLAFGTDRSARLLFRNLRTRGLMHTHTICLSDLHGRLPRNLRLIAELKPMNLNLAQRPHATMPPNGQHIPAGGTYLRRETATAKKKQTLTLLNATIRLKKNSHGIITDYRSPCLNLRLAPVPDGQFLLVAQAPQDAVAAVIRPRNHGTFIMLPIHIANSANMLY